MMASEIRWCINHLERRLLLLLLWLVEEAPDSACFLWVCWMCGQINMSAISTFYCSHMLQPDWSSGQFTASTTETKSLFNITVNLWMLLTSLISSVYSASCLMGLCESLWTWFGSEVLLSLSHFITVKTVSWGDETQQEKKDWVKHLVHDFQILSFLFKEVQYFSRQGSSWTDHHEHVRGFNSGPSYFYR